MVAVSVHVGDRTQRHTAVGSGLGHGRRNHHHQARVKRLGDEVLGAKSQRLAHIGRRHHLTLLGLGQLGNSMHGGNFHLRRDGGGAAIERPAVIAQRIEKFGLRLKEGVDYDVVNTDFDHRYRDFWQTYHQMTARKGITAPIAKIEMRRRLTLIGSMMLHKGEVDGLICGTWGTTANHLLYIDQVIGKHAGGCASTSQDVPVYACMNGLLLPGRQVFLVDTHVNYDPTPEELAEITTLAAEEMMRFGIKPEAALLSHSNFGTSNHPSAVKMRQTLALLRQQAPWLEVDGEMHGDVALDGKARAAIMPGSELTDDANLLVFPNIDAANIAYNLLKTAAGGGIAIGPVLLGAAKPVHVLTPSATVRRIVNMTALTVADANALR